MKRLLFILLAGLMISFPAYGADTAMEALTDGSGTVAGTDHLIGYATTGPAARRYTINSILALKTQASLHIDDILTALGIASEALHFGTFTGSTIPDNQTAKAAIQAVETAVETKESATSNDFDPDRLAGDTTDDDLIDQDIIEGMTATSAPYMQILDSDAPGTDKEIGGLGGAYVDGADTAENGTASLFVHEAGTRTEYIQADGKNLDVEIKKVLVPEGGIKSLTPVIDDPDNFAANFTGANLYGGTFIANAAGTAALPDPAVGMNFTYVMEGANANTVDPLGTGTADTIYMNGLAAAQDENITSSTSGAICVFQYRAANTWMATCNGFAEATPP